MPGPKESVLHMGYPRYLVYRETLVAETVKTLDVDTDFDGASAKILVEHMGNVTNDVYVTFALNEGAVAPTSDGSGDTTKKMHRFQQDEKKSFDLMATEIKLMSAGAVQVQVTIHGG